MERLEHRACFGGWQDVYRHRSEALGCDMTVGVYYPPQADPAHPRHRPCPVLYWLSGLTCTEQNFITKAGAQRYAAEHGIILVAPDTSPRGEGVPDAEAWDLGQGAGFYLDARRAPWATHYRMQTYIVEELPEWIEAHPAACDARAISGHSMGGHGALVLALRHPGRYRSVSAFSPIVAPSQVPWGRKAFGAYLGEDEATWREWDACALLACAEHRTPLLVDQGGDDEFLETQLQPGRLRVACEEAGHPLVLRVHPGYDHSYYFIATFIGDHIAHHARALGLA